MRSFIFILISSFLSVSALADNDQEKNKIERAVRDYIESQHQTNPEMMKRGIDPELAKRTYWKSKEKNEFIKQSGYEDMVRIAAEYNKNGDKFPSSPKIEIEIFDIDQRVASAKLIADNWIDYMHLYKNDQDQWKIINVLWQFNDIDAHTSK